ncbi:MAG: PLDc N-terminal domain-containing protein [Eubacteriales bacterium]
MPDLATQLTHLLPVLIPLGILELALTTASLIHVLTHKTYKTGTRTLWIILSFVNIIGPVLYFIIGRGDE